MKSYTICLCLMSLSSALAAQPRPFAEKLFDRFLIGNENGSRYVEGYCEPRTEKSESMRCSLKEGVLLPPKTRTPFSESDKDQVRKSICSPDSVIWGRMRRPGWGKETKAELEAMEGFCRDADIGKLNAAFAAIDAKTCRYVSFPAMIYEFRRTERGKWSAKFKAMGDCKVAGSYELEQPWEDSLAYNLKMTLESARTNDPEVCAELWDKREFSYRWDQPKKYEPPCDLIEWATPIP